MNYKEISPYELDVKVCRAIGKEWMLIGAEHGGITNAMTASWGFLGELWNKPATVCFIRPQRYTFPLVDRADCYSLSFFGDERHEMLAYFGAHSGRDGDKAAACGMKYAYADTGDARVPYLDGAKYVLICRKMYCDDIKPECFTEPEIIAKCYPQRDFHRVFIGGIVKCLLRDDG
ncbi:MAG: flavin reductase [Eubacteriales bacterium]